MKTRKTTNMPRKFMVIAIFFAGLTSSIDSRATLTLSNFESRLNSRTITFDDLAFSNALDSFSSTFRLNGAIGDSGTFVFGTATPLGQFGGHFFSGAGVSLSNTSYPSGGAAGHYTAQIVGSTDVSFSIGAAVAAATPADPPGYSTLILDSNGIDPTLEFKLVGGNGGLKVGGISVVSGSLKGRKLQS